MGQIVVLDRNMVNMIAAGEVVERPASVVKELMENSIDAGATKVIVSVEDGGRKLISVADNGCGMDAEDLARAFDSHTTSKIKRSCDLRAISTLGFRGEALASIASVAQVRAASKTKDSAGASCICVDCGNKDSVRPCSADYGTTIQLRDIFYRMPARRKFLKTANTEMTHITEQFTRIALANCALDMTLMHNARELCRLPGDQGLHRRIAELFPTEISENLVETESSERDLHIFALLGKPGISRTNSRFQYVFLNGRFIRDRFISHAIKEAYHGTLEPNRFPVVFLFIQMPCEDVDVNVHPTKIEVRFHNANLVHSQVLGALREKLLATNLDAYAKLPTTPHPKNASPHFASVREQRITDAMAEFFKRHRPVQTQQQGFPIDDFRLTIENRKPEFENRKFPNAIQIHDSFIVAETDDGFVVIDQHALHERIIYEALRRRIQKSKLESQKLLIPETLRLTDAQADALETNAELIEKLGIELAPFGPGPRPHTYAIQAFPSLLAKAEPLDFVRDLLDLLDRQAAALGPEELLDEVLNMAACKAAIKAGQNLSQSEIEQLLADRQSIERPSRCPHGRPTTIKFSLSDLEKQFKRT